MIANPSSEYISPETYLEVEQDSPLKHEYRQGQAYAMAGASNAHVLIAGNLFAMLRNHLRGSGCLTYISDTKAHIESINTYYYPDVMVSCDQRIERLTTFCVILA